MKYPLVLFFRHEQYSYIDKIFLNPDDKILHSTVECTSDVNKLNNLFNSNYHVLVTFGDTEQEYHSDIHSVITNRMRSQWIHMQTIENLNDFSHYVNSCYITHCIKDRTNIRPIFSIFTTTFNSYDKILRAYNSLTKQILKDWEWVIMDDSTDENHFNYLVEKLDADNRVRLYKRSKNSGSIGNVKNEAISLCRGQYLLELDHDDELIEYTLSDSAKVFNDHSDVGFVYMDFINIYENGNNFQYGDFFGKGYCGYYLQKYNDRWVYVAVTPNINSTTITSLICLPNHPRIWRKSVLMEMGNYNEYLPICDDLEILLKTVLHTKIAKIPKMGYVQYMNNENNNFSLIRNGEINRLQPHYIVPIFNKLNNVSEKMKELGVLEDDIYLKKNSRIWTRKDYEYKYCNLVIQPDYDAQYCILGMEAFYLNFDKIFELYKNPRNDFLFLEGSIAKKDANSGVYDLIHLVEKYNMTRIKCYTMDNMSDEDLTSYFNMIYKSCDTSIIFSVNKEYRNTKDKLVLDYNAGSLYDNYYDIVNALTIPHNSYLEIGVEFGKTFKNVHCLTKTGVDPLQKCEDDRIIFKTSDDFFRDNTETFDVIFIDGMHQVEYFVKDFVNSMSALNNGGILMIADLLPITHNEQLDIPIKHYYDKGILQYGEPWTGTVWKCVYYLLKHYGDKFKITYYNNNKYRGIGVLKNIELFTIDVAEATAEMLTYKYYDDFPNYLVMLTQKSI